MFEVPMLQNLHALGYLDGGTGSMLFQAAMGSLLAVGYFTATQWGRFKAFFLGVLTGRATKQTQS